MTNNGKATTKLIIGLALVAIGFVLIFFIGSFFFTHHISFVASGTTASSTATSSLVATTTPTLPLFPPVVHIPTPQPLKAIYMTGWVAGVKRIREPLVKLVDTTELNAIVVDIKDYTGMISYEIEDPDLKAVGSGSKRIPDIRMFLDELHKKNIYVIGRLATFQDPYYVKIHPEYAVRTKSGAVWQDHKGIKWLDAGAKPVWDYMIAIARQSYDIGFDEINFDYIRFPSDGNMNDIVYPYSGTTTKSIVLNHFFEYIASRLTPEGIPISADLFGMTTSNTDDLNIGQILENALANFDYVAPMVYPSHYPAGFNGYKNPNAQPYAVIKYAMGKAVTRATMASTTPLKLRPWLQDFSLYGITYTAPMVRTQIQATYDTGLDSWMLWNASNHYTAGALNKE